MIIQVAPGVSVHAQACKIPQPYSSKVSLEISAGKLEPHAIDTWYSRCEVQLRVDYRSAAKASH